MMEAAAYARTALGPYNLLAKIGEGGMGTVYLARMDGPAGVDKLAVVKELRADVARDPDFIAMFLNEARLATRLTHPNVVHTYGASEDTGRLYIAMEYLDGQPWVRVRHRLWSNRSLPLSLHLHVLAETLAGLHYAHSLKSFNGTPLQVVHCDVSPQNVFVTYDGQVKIVDFGVARAVTSTGSENPELFAGKLSYAAPEQVLRQQVDRRADVFAVGVMLWEALAGRRFVEGFEKTEILRRRVAGKEPRVREVVPSVPRALADMCDRALCIDPRDRFASAADFRNAILDYLSQTAQRTDNSQLGNTVDAAFREERAKVHGFIEDSLAHPERDNQGPLLDLGTGAESAEDTLRADLSEFVSVSRIADDQQLAEASIVAAVKKPDKSKSRPVIIAGGIATAALATVALLWSTSHRPTGDVDGPNRAPATAATAENGASATDLPAQSTSPAQATAPTPATTPAPAVAPTPVAPTAPAAPATQIGAEQAVEEQAPQQVSITFSATPETALLAVDGRPLPSNPYTGPFEIGTRLHTLSAGGLGLQRKEVRIRFDRDRAVALELLPVRERKPTRRRARTADPLPPAPEPSPLPSRPVPTNAAPTKPQDKLAAPPVEPTRAIYEEDPY